MRHFRRAAVAAVIAALTPVWPAGAETRPVVVELFTSQGCSSCPPADALLQELAGRKDVLALGFHISYWDNLGWKDPLSSPEATQRQRDYARRFHPGRVFTPEIVVDGVDEMVGSDRAAVTSAMRAPREAAAAVDFAADRHAVTIGPGSGEATVYVVRFARHRTTHVRAGENGGRIIEDANGVLSLSRLGSWSGTQVSFAIDPPAPGEGVAVLVQTPDGRMLGAGSVLALPASADPASKV